MRRIPEDQALGLTDWARLVTLTVGTAAAAAPLLGAAAAVATAATARGGGGRGRGGGRARRSRSRRRCRRGRRSERRGGRGAGRGGHDARVLVRRLVVLVGGLVVLVGRLLGDRSRLLDRGRGRVLDWCELLPPQPETASAAAIAINSIFFMPYSFAGRLRSEGTRERGRAGGPAAIAPGAGRCLASR